MQQPRNKTTGRWRTLSLVLAGIMIGGALIGPVSAAVSLDRDDRRFVRKTARKIANKRKKKVIKQLQPQINANAAALGTKQTACQPGSVLAFVHVDVSEVTATPPNYSPAGLSARYNCKDPAGANTVTIQEGSNFFRIRFAGITDVVPNTTKYVTQATINHFILQGVTIHAFPFELDGQLVIDVYMENEAGAQDAFDFSVALFGYSGLPGTTGLSPVRAPVADAPEGTIPEEVAAATG